MSEQETQNAVELIDDEGNLVEYTIEDSFIFDEKYYVVLGDHTDEAILFRINNPEDPTEFIRPDEDEFNRVKEAYYESE